MNIALIAQDHRKELMAEFCIAYSGILGQHKLYATGTTGAIVRDAAGLNVERFAPGLLGFQQIIAKAAYNELDMVLFFRDGTLGPDHSKDTEQLFRTCDSNLIPYATSIATAELLIKGLERGDLDWRLLV
ncbi:MAG TPA: methylglyoxal synthase [Clostridiales bacterium]|nr:methylglyoxal synthase [Clostridiales bacterium]